jgi:diguanylate cyclase (GGDEF)-like protein
MLANNSPTFLLASNEPALLSTIEPLLLAAGARVEIVLSAEAALASMTAANPPNLALLDANLPGLDPSLDMSQLLTAVRAAVSGKRLPIVLIADKVNQEWTDSLADGVIDDLIPRGTEPTFWQIRIDMVLRNHQKVRELEQLREASTLNAQMDHLTGVYNRQTLISMLFRETDRVQRMKSSLCMILFDIDDFAHWNNRLGIDACDELLCQVVGRTSRLLRSYDLLGRVGEDEFICALPGCSTVDAVMLTERIRMDVFCTPFRVGGESIRLSACFGLASSSGRSPVVVLREAEQALQTAKAAGPESIQCFDDSLRPASTPVTYLSPSSGDELLAW